MLCSRALQRLSNGPVGEVLEDGFVSRLRRKARAAAGTDMVAVIAEGWMSVQRIVLLLVVALVCVCVCFCQTVKCCGTRSEEDCLKFGKLVGEENLFPGNRFRK